MASFTVNAGVTNNTRQTLVGNETGTIQATGVLSVSNENQTIRFNGVTTGATVNNSGTVENTAAAGRAIRLNDNVGTTPNVTINNIGAASIIRANDDAIQQEGLQNPSDGGPVTAGSVTVTNDGLIRSFNEETIDFEDTGGTFVLTVTNNATGDIFSDDSDAFRIGSASASNLVSNSGEIDGGSDTAAYSGGDGVQFEDNAAGTVQNQGSGAISGDRHAINAGVGTTVTVTNAVNATITGRNGSGVGLDGNGSVTNFGIITGAFSNSAGSDINGTTPGQPNGGGADGILDGDGDGIDIDGQATIVNSGTIQGTGAGGSGSDGFLNTSEGIAAGGGSITNNVGGVITGVGLGILIDDSSQGNAPFVTTVDNDGTITGTTGIAIRIISNLNDTVTNNGTISGGGGVAIQFGSGANTLFIENGSAITGQSQGGLGTDTLDYSGFTASGVTVNLVTGTSNGTGGVTGFENAVGTGATDYFVSSSTIANTFTGGGGDDRYEVEAIDTVVEAAAGGTDTVRTFDTYTLLAEFERLTLLGPTALDGTGNAAANTLTGNVAANRLDGGGGTDILQGGLGDDTYVTDGGDTIIEVSTGGFDSVESSVTHTLSLNVERLTLTGNGNLDGTGNGSNNTIIGNSGNNLLNGGNGSDTLEGGGGNDIYFVTDQSDTIVEALAGGNDLVRATVSVGLSANVERLTLQQGFGAIDGTGSVDNNIIAGNESGNLLDGAGGNDTLLGGLGADTFRFSTALDSATNIDIVTDFFIAQGDIIQLENTGVGLFNALADGALAVGALNFGFVATEADDRILYNQTTGALRYDPDGTGNANAVLFAYLSNTNQAITEASFFVV